MQAHTYTFRLTTMTSLMGRWSCSATPGTYRDPFPNISPKLQSDPVPNWWQELRFAQQDNHNANRRPLVSFTATYAAATLPSGPTRDSEWVVRSSPVEDGGGTQQASLDAFVGGGQNQNSETPLRQSILVQALDAFR